MVFLSLLLGEVENNLFLIVGVEEGFSLSEAIMRAMLFVWTGESLLIGKKPNTPGK
jgi:hypothetical protein